MQKRIPSNVIFTSTEVIPPWKYVRACSAWKLLYWYCILYMANFYLHYIFSNFEANTQWQRVSYTERETLVWQSLPVPEVLLFQIFLSCCQFSCLHIFASWKDFLQLQRGLPVIQPFFSFTKFEPSRLFQRPSFLDRSRHLTRFFQISDILLPASNSSSVLQIFSRELPQSSCAATTTDFTTGH